MTIEGTLVARFIPPAARRKALAAAPACALALPACRSTEAPASSGPPRAVGTSETKAYGCGVKYADPT